MFIINYIDILSILKIVFSAKFMNYRIKYYIYCSKTFLAYWKKYVLWETKIGNHFERSKLKNFKAKSFSSTLIGDIKETTKISLLDNEKSIRQDYLKMAKVLSGIYWWRTKKKIFHDKMMCSNSILSNKSDIKHVVCTW